MTVLDAMANARLVTVDDQSVEVAHEALLREWPRLRGWLDEVEGFWTAHLASFKARVEGPGRKRRR